MFLFTKFNSKLFFVMDVEYPNLIVLDKLPLYIKNALINSNLFELEDHDDRFRLFLAELYSINPKLSYGTVKKYVKLVKSTLFKNTTLKIDYTKYKKTVPQQRFLSNNEMQKLKFFILNDYKNYKSWPIIFCFFTGLRLSELKQIYKKHLIDLLNKKREILIYRKNGKIWEPVYHKSLLEFTDFLVKENVDFGPVFVQSKSNIHYNLRQYYRKCFNSEPSLGFGIHFIRYSIATILQENGKEHEIKKALGHTSDETKHIYIKNNNLVQEKLNNYKTATELWSC